MCIIEAKVIHIFQSYYRYIYAHYSRNTVFYAAISQLSALYCLICSCGVMISNGLLSLSIVKADKLRHFSRLFRIYADELLDGDNLSLFDDGLLRGFAELDDIDRHGILNLIKFKKMMKNKKN